MTVSRDRLLVEMAHGRTVESLELEMLSGRTAADYEKEAKKPISEYRRNDIKWNRLFHLLKTLVDEDYETKQRKKK